MKILERKITRELFNSLVEYDFDIEQQGVYLIGDYYIGKSFNIKERIINHIHQTFNFEFTNIYKEEKILYDLLNKGKIKITLLSNNQDDENELIEKYCNILPLTNIKEHPLRDNDIYMKNYLNKKNDKVNNFSYDFYIPIINKFLITDGAEKFIKNRLKKLNLKKQKNFINALEAKKNRLKKIKKEHKNRLLFMEALEAKEDINISLNSILGI